MYVQKMTGSPRADTVALQTLAEKDMTEEIKQKSGTNISKVLINGPIRTVKDMMVAAGQPDAEQDHIVESSLAEYDKTWSMSNKELVAMKEKEPACATFMASPGMWHHSWQDIDFGETPQKYKPAPKGVLPESEARVSKEAKLIPWMAWNLSGKKATWGAINFALPSKIQSYSDGDMQEHAAKIVQEVIERINAHCPDAPYTIRHEHHKLVKEELNFRQYYAKHCSSERTAICVLDASSEKRLLKMYLGMGTKLDREDVCGLVTICKDMTLLGALFSVLQNMRRSGLNPENFEKLKMTVCFNPEGLQEEAAERALQEIRDAMRTANPGTNAPFPTLEVNKPAEQEIGSSSSSGSGTAPATHAIVDVVRAGIGAGFQQ